MVIPNFIKQCSNNESLTIYGNGSQTRSFCYVNDLIEGLTKLMDSDYSCPINLGNNQEISIKRLADLIKSKINEKIEIGKFFNKVYGSPKTKIECVEDFIESKDINLNNCLFIGDSKSDLQCANHFDMKFLFIKNEYNKHVIVDEDIPQVENFL